MIPKYSPEESNVASILDRLMTLERQMKEVNDLLTTQKGQMINIAADVASMRIDKFVTMTATPTTVKQAKISCIGLTWSEILQQPQSCRLYHLGMSDPSPRKWLLPNTGPVTGTAKVE